MRGCRHLRRLTATLAVAGAGAVACGNDAGTPDGAARRYLDDASYRRSELQASLVAPSDGYAQTRLAHYASGDADDWDRLPEWNPAVEPVAARELDAPVGAPTRTLSPAAAPLDLGDLADLAASITSEDDPRLVDLGGRAFMRYPTQLAPYFAVAVASRSASSRYGLWVDDGAGVSGLVRVRLADGSASLAMTCATCHASKDGAGGALVPGLPNAALDLGAATLAASAAIDPVVAAWGPGRLDVTTTTGKEPVRIPDLRPVRLLTHLHHDATLAARDRTTLAIRIETLIVTSYGETVRPPRIVALALAAFVASLADTLPSIDAAAEQSPRGAELFAHDCAGCHAPPGMTGAPVPLAAIGTDPTLGLSAERGTGTYRVPSLRGVGTRGPLLHDGSLPSLDALFDPGRLALDYRGGRIGAGPVPGHRFGLDASADDRAALVAYLRAL